MLQIQGIGESLLPERVGGAFHKQQIITETFNDMVFQIGMTFDHGLYVRIASDKNSVIQPEPGERAFPLQEPRLFSQTKE